MQKTVRYTIRIVFGGQDYIFFLCCQVGLLSVHDLDDEQRATFMTRFIPRPPPSGNIQAEKTRAPHHRYPVNNIELGSLDIAGALGRVKILILCERLLYTRSTSIPHGTST